MTVAAGSFTVGLGEDYDTWEAAMADIEATLTGDLTLTQAAATTETGRSSTKSIALAGYTLTMTSDTPPLGNPLGGWISTLDAAADTLNMIMLSVTGTGACDIGNLNFRRTGTPTLATMVVVDSAGPDLAVHDCIAISTHSSGTMKGILVSDNSGASGSTDIDVWNCVVSGCSIGLEAGLGYTAVVTVENCTAFDNAENFRNNAGAVEWLDNVAFDHSGTADFNNIGAANGTNNADEDGTGADGNWNSGTGNITAIVPATEFVSISTSSADMVKVTDAGALHDGGAAATIGANTLGVRGNARPGTDTNYSMGADELVLNPTVTGVVPNDGDAAGGTPVSVAGTLFVAGATVKFGGASATSVVVVGATEITCTTPAGTGVVDVVVTNLDTGVGTLAGGFSYLGGVATQTVVTVSTRLGEGSAGLFRASPGLSDIMNKIADNLAFLKLASQQDNFAEFKLAMEDLDALQADPLPQFGPYPKELGTVQIPERFGEAMRISRAEASRLQGLLEVLTRVSEILVGMKAASQLTDFAAFKVAMAALATVQKSNDSRV